jgi:hypothetical protein
MLFFGIFTFALCRSSNWLSLGVFWLGDFFLDFFNMGLLNWNNWWIWLNKPKFFGLEVEVFDNVNTVISEFILSFFLSEVGIVSISQKVDWIVMDMRLEDLLNDLHRVLSLDFS